MINQGQEHVTNQHKNSPGLSVLQASAPDLPPSSPPFNWNLPLLLFGSKTTTNCLYLPVPGESVTVRTKRREKRRKLLLSAFGNIYPPFIVTLLYLENLIIPRVCNASARFQNTTITAGHVLNPSLHTLGVV